MFGNGLSTSPSNNPACGLAPDFRFTHLDNIRAQEQLLFQVFAIEQLALIYGWSMGAQQAYHWGALYLVGGASQNEIRVARIVAICGTAKTTEHNQIFLESLKSALTADRTWTGQRFEGISEQGFRTFARIYAS
jgi:homoserine O-acetyltransferase/O-succinyltransferase